MTKDEYEKLVQKSIKIEFIVNEIIKLVYDNNIIMSCLENNCFNNDWNRKEYFVILLLKIMKETNQKIEIYLNKKIRNKNRSKNGK